MTDRKAFLLRLDPVTLAALQRWADEELRSLNSQIEYVLRQGLRDSGRLPGQGATGPGESGEARTRTPNPEPEP